MFSFFIYNNSINIGNIACVLIFTHTVDYLSSQFLLNQYQV